MYPTSATVPADSDVLCEACGYTLNGLPSTGNCPECGTAVAWSTSDSGRALPAWERERHFWATTQTVVFKTAHFYRTLKTRVPPEQHRTAYGFALRHWFLAGLLVALASGVHYSLVQGAWLPAAWEQRTLLVLLWVGLITALAGLGAMAVTHLAAWLSAWEAGWRGYRLPHDVALRALCYHAAHLLPAAGTILLIVVGYRALWNWGVLGYESLVSYLIVLSAATVLAAIYLFWTYWIGMKNMLYANE